MALYLSLVLAAEFVAFDSRLSSRPAALHILWGTAIGLTLAHVFAFNLSALLFSAAWLAETRRQAIALQVLAAAGVAAILSVPFFVLDLSKALALDRFLIAGFLGGTGWAIARAAGRSTVQAMMVGFTMLALGIGVVLAKAALEAH